MKYLDAGATGILEILGYSRWGGGTGISHLTLRQVGALLPSHPLLSGFVFPAAFSTPEVHVDYNSSWETLRCEAPRWFPQPVVMWTSPNVTGNNLSEVVNTSFKLNSENVTMKVVSFLHNITANTTYTCVIKNDIAKATGDIQVTGTCQPASDWSLRLMLPGKLTLSLLLQGRMLGGLGGVEWTNYS